MGLASPATCRKIVAIRTPSPSLSGPLLSYSMPSFTRASALPAPRTEGVDPLTVDAAILTLTPRFTTDRPLTVAGKVMEVRSQYPRWHYVSLAGTDAQLTVRLQKDLPPPRSNQTIVVRGVLSVQASKFTGGLEVLLTGALVGTYKPLTGPQSGLALERNRPPMRLAALVLRDQVPRIAALCSNIGAEDAQSACTRFGIVPPWTQIRVGFGDKEAMIASIQKMGDDPAHEAVVVLRGGGDAKSLEMWDDPDVVEALLALGKPFYTALGHSTHVLLADRFADEFFDTPTAFGSAVGQTLAQQHHHASSLEELRRQCGSLRSQMEAGQASYQRQLATLQEDFRQEKESAGRTLAVAVVLGVAVALLLLLLALS